MKRKRVGMVIKADAAKLELYKQLHAGGHAGVRDLLAKYHIHHFSIFLQALDDGVPHLFGYYEYTGDDYDRDMAKLNEEPRNIEWLALTAACQIPLKERTGWTLMEQVYYNE